MFKKLFSIILGDDKSSAQPRQSAGGVAVAAGEPDLDGFVRFVVESLVDDPSQVVIDRDDSDEEIKITIDCDKKDIGRIIGRKGRNIDSIRSLVRGAARRSNQKVTVEITDK